MMLEREMVFPALIDLLAHEKIFVRVGAMMVMEEIAARRRDITAQVVDAVWDRFYAAEARVKGDIIHVLGEIGDERVLPRMRRIHSEDYHQEVKEAAGEAIEKIETSAE
jgi:HEAT repeat protein